MSVQPQQGGQVTYGNTDACLLTILTKHQPLHCTISSSHTTWRGRQHVIPVAVRVMGTPPKTERPGACTLLSCLDTITVTAHSSM